MPPQYELDKMLLGVMDNWFDGEGCHWCGRNTREPMERHDGLCPVPALFSLHAEIAEVRNSSSMKHLFRLQESLPVESGVGLASGWNVATTVIIDYINKLCAAVERLQYELKMQTIRAEHAESDIGGVREEQWYEVRNRELEAEIERLRDECAKTYAALVTVSDKEDTSLPELAEAIVLEIKRLHTEVERLRAERDALREALQQYQAHNRMRNDTEAELYNIAEHALSTVPAPAQAALKKYGQHLMGCPQSRLPGVRGMATMMPCTCGFDAALAAVPAPLPEVAEAERLRAQRDALRLCASLLVEWRRTPFFETRGEWEKWMSDFGVRVDAALHALLDADVAHLRAAVPAQPQADRIEQLRDALDEALTGWTEAAQYKGDFLMEKHGDMDDIRRLSDVLGKRRSARVAGGISVEEQEKP